MNTVQQEPPRPSRREDPRMHKAVAARLKDPRMPLYQALVEGGFGYAEDYPHVVDSEGVSLAQRKNQLSRRLRHTKQQNRKRKAYDHLMDEESFSNHAQFGGLFVHENIPTKQRRRQQTQPQLQNEKVDTTKAALIQLSHIASTVGITLEQFAVSLGNYRNLAQALKGTSGRQEMALSFYKVGNRKLLIDCMLQAGYPKEVAQDETSEDFRVFALAAWIQEGDALKKQKGEISLQP